MMDDPYHDDSTPALINISPRTILRLSGPDRLRFLNGDHAVNVRSLHAARSKKR